MEHIGDILDSAGVVGNGRRWALDVRLHGDGGDLRAGTYTLQAERALRHHPLDAAGRPGRCCRRCGSTIPEGHALRDIARDDAPRAGISPAAYRRAARRAHPPAGYRATGKERLTIEGFLFPATYTLTKPVSATRLVQQQLTAFQRADGEGRLPPGREEEPDALRRADHRLDDRARGRLPGRPRQDRRRHLQPPARGHATRHRRDHPVPRGLVARAQRARPARHGRRTTRAPTGACRRRRSAIPAWRRSRPRRSPRRCPTCTTSRSRAIPSGATTSRARSPTSSTSSRRIRHDHLRRDARRLRDRRPGRALALAAHAQRGLGGARARPRLRRVARGARRPGRGRARPAGARRRRRQHHAAAQGRGRRALRRARPRGARRGRRQHAQLPGRTAGCAAT